MKRNVNAQFTYNLSGVRPFFTNADLNFSVRKPKVAFPFAFMYGTALTSDKNTLGNQERLHKVRGNLKTSW